jgi:excisionase family DNA binding protein
MTKPTDPPKTLLTKKQVAELLGTSAKTIDRRIRSGDLPAIRDGRIVRVHPDDLERYLAKHRSARLSLSVQV